MSYVLAVLFCLLGVGEVPQNRKHTAPHTKKHSRITANILQKTNIICVYSIDIYIYLNMYILVGLYICFIYKYTYIYIFIYTGIYIIYIYCEYVYVVEKYGEYTFANC